MRIISIIAIILLIVGPSPLAITVHEAVDFGCRFAVPEGWTVDSSYEDRIIIAGESGDNLEIIIKKHVLAAEHTITSDEELAMAIAGLYDELGLENANSGEVTYENDGGRATFQHSAVYYDSADRNEFRQSVKGLLVRAIDGRQVLFLIITSADADRYGMLLPELNLLLNTFEITDAHLGVLYPRRSLTPYLLILFFFILIALFYARGRRIQRSKNPLGRDSGNFWRCGSCRKVNHIENSHCSRCGRERTEPATAGR